VFENRVMRRMFGPERGEVVESWRRLRKEEIHNLYSSPVIVMIKKIMKDELGGACGVHGRDKSMMYQCLTKYHAMKTYAGVKIQPHNSFIGT
jgi:hypothetical protein